MDGNDMEPSLSSGCCFAGLLESERKWFNVSHTARTTTMPPSPTSTASSKPLGVLGFGMSEVAAWYQDGSRVMVAVVEWRRRWPKGRQRFGIVVRQKPFDLKAAVNGISHRREEGTPALVKHHHQPPVEP
ncbi:hypothetical protein WN943_008237 [Citrus x changshan-huyou]